MPLINRLLQHFYSWHNKHWKTVYLGETCEDVLRCTCRHTNIFPHTLVTKYCYDSCDDQQLGTHTPEGAMKQGSSTVSCTPTFCPISCHVCYTKLLLLHC